MIKIYTFQFNDADFLEYQHKTFKRFLKQEHELICINNSYDKPHEKSAIQNKAAELGIVHHFPQNVDHSQGGYSHQTAIQWVWDKFIANSTDINMIVDHDMFLIRDFSPDLNYDLTGIMQGRGEHIKYLHPGFMVINNTLKDRETVSFKGEVIDGHACDSGGNMHHYLQSHPDLKIKGLNLVNICSEQGNMDVIPSEIHNDYYEINPMQIGENFLLHCRDGSNWSWTEKSIYEKKKKQLFYTLNYYMSQ